MVIKKFITRQVLIGNIAIGANNPIAIQSMTNTKTEDVNATVNQIISLSDIGCEIVRMTVQGKKQAFALEKIKNELLKKNYTIPLVADIHFYPPAAFIAADFVEKVRINPGNFAEKRSLLNNQILSNDIYQKELEKVEEKLLLLISKLKKNKVALRIGVNLGSLSDRILNKYGNTIKGMVVSAIEYVNICRKHDFHNIVFSMKTSSAFMTMEAYRALVQEMIMLGYDYPLHLGVTEAGDEEDGILKSSVGIGSLLLEGIGDTIRVSLTENPIKEIMPAKKLIENCYNKSKRFFLSNNLDKKVSKENLVAVIDEDIEIENSKEKLKKIDLFYFKTSNLKFFKEVKKIKKPIISKLDIEGSLKILTSKDLKDKKNKSIFFEKPYVLEMSEKDDFNILKIFEKPQYIIFKTEKAHIDEIKKIKNFLLENNIDIPLIAHLVYEKENIDNLKILAPSETGLILFDKIADFILIESKFKSSKDLNISLDILQSCGLKKYKTEYISCPGCGRTSYDILKTLKTIKTHTNHLPDIKIAVMGCIVNGLGEMRDADFGYIGSKPGKIDLYYNKQVIEKDIDENNALECLISLIKEKGRWKEKL